MKGLAKKTRIMFVMLLLVITMSSPLHVAAFGLMLVFPQEDVRIPPNYNEFDFIGFEPMVAPLIPLAWAALKQALPYLLLTATGLIIEHNVSDSDRNSFLELFYEGTKDAFTPGKSVVGNAIGSVWDATGLSVDFDASGELTMSPRYMAYDPVTGQQKPAFKLPVRELEKFTYAVRDEMSDFVGPIDLDAANVQWLNGRPVKVHLAGSRFLEDILLGMYLGMPVFDEKILTLTENEQFQILRNFNTEMFENISHGFPYNFTLGDIVGGYSTVYRIVRMNGNFINPQTPVSHMYYGINTRHPILNATLSVDGLSIQNVISHGFMVINHELYTGASFNIWYGRRWHWEDSWEIINKNVTAISRVTGFGGLLANPNQLDMNGIPYTPAIDVSISPNNILTNPAAAMQAVRDIAGAQTDDDDIYIWWPNSIEELLEMLAAANAGAGTVVIPGDWNVTEEDEEEKPIVLPPGSIPQDWLDNISDQLDGIRDDMRHRQAWEDTVSEQVGSIAHNVAQTRTATQTIADVLTIGLVGDLNFRLPTVGGGIMNRFPFSIPFSFVSGMETLVVMPQAPRFEVDFTGTILDAQKLGGSNEYVNQVDMGEISESGMQGAKFVIDLKDFETIAFYMRWGIWVLFAFGLMKTTPNFIKW